MKKILSIFALAAMALCSVCCQKPDEEFLHDDYTISSIYMSNPQNTTVPQISGKIDQETGDIYFEIAKKWRSYWLVGGETIPVKVKATVGYDVKITPSLSGLKNIGTDEPFDITCTATMTGESKTYHLYIKYLLN